MALPTLVKTQQTTRNNTVTARGGAGYTKLQTMHQIKLILCGTAGAATTGLWTVVSSSNAYVQNPGSINQGTASTGDNWGTGANINGPDAVDDTWGARFPWIVLQQSALGGGTAQICISLPSMNDSTGTLVFSPSAGFTGGTVSARPTATDEFIVINATGIHSGVDVQHQIHAWQSSDGEFTRVVVWRGGTNMCLSFGVEKPQDVVTGWTNPCFAWGIGGGAGIPLTYAVMNTNAGFAKGKGSALFQINFTCEAFGSTMFPNLTDIGTVVNSFDSAWPFFGIGIGSTTLNHKGRHGSLFDLWYKPVSVNDADTFPNDANDRKFVAFGPLIMPWHPGGATVPLLT